VAQLRLTTLLANNAIGEWFTSRGRPHETSTRRLRREIRHRVRRTDHVQMGNREGGKKSPFTRAPHERIGWAFRSKFVTIADRPHPSRHLSGTITLFGGLAKDRIAAGYQHASLNDPLTGRTSWLSPGRRTADNPQPTHSDVTVYQATEKGHIFAVRDWLQDFIQYVKPEMVKAVGALRERMPTQVDNHA
jgi:hypothetical protein